MKKNIFSDNESSKGSKGFYAALGISALMIGSACYFAYDQGEKISENNKIIAENSIDAQDEAVDKKSTGIPKITTSAVNTQASAATATTAVVTASSQATIPAAIIATDTPPTSAVTGETATQPSEARLENPKAPLADMSNIITPFSGSELVKNETTGSWQTHNGIDIAAEIGTDVYAVSPGQITAVNEDPLWGITVIIDHYNGFVTKYCGLAKDLSVQKGDTVVSGDIIGVLGGTADIESALAPHLHFELLHNGSYADPAAFINS